MECSDNNDGPGGIYHYHKFKAGEGNNYKNKVIGYSIDGHAIMGRHIKFIRFKFKCKKN